MLKYTTRSSIGNWVFMKQQELLQKIYWISAVLTGVILAFLASVIFLNPSSVGNPSFVWNINLWALAWALNFIIVLVLFFLLARHLVKLFFEASPGFFLPEP